MGRYYGCACKQCTGDLEPYDGDNTEPVDEAPKTVESGKITLRPTSNEREQGIADGD